jgi:hypothetical protein
VIGPVVSRRMRSRRACFAALALLCACHPSDYVALRPAPAIDAGKPPRWDAGNDSGPALESGDDSGPANDASSAGDAAVDAMMPTPLCRPRACGQAPSHDQVCNAAAPLLALGDGCAANSGRPSFRFALCSCAGIVTNGALYVDGTDPANLAIDGDASFNAAVQIAGSLQLVGSLMTSGMNAAMVMVADGIREHTDPACACAPEDALDIAGLVASFAADSANDDHSAGLDRGSLSNTTAATTQVLPCGRYYFQRIAGAGRLQLQAEGNVAIFVDGDVQLQDELVIDTSAGAHVTLVVNGGLVAPHGMTLGSLDRPNDVLLLIGGPGNINLDQKVTLGGSLYAPNAQLVTRGPVEVAGSLFVQRAQVDQELRLHYEPPAADSCQ